VPYKPPASRPTVSLRAAAQIGPADAADPKKPRTFRLVANTGEPMRIWPFDQPVVVDLDTIDVSGLPVPALYDHCPDVDFAVGNVTAAAVEGSQFVASGVFTVDGSVPVERNYALKVLNKADAGFSWQTSIGGDPAITEEVKAGASVTVNGRTYAGPVIVARGVQLREISFVVLGGDRRTSAVVARHRIKGSATMPTFEEYVASLGFDPAALDATQTANLKLQYAEAYPEGGAGEMTDADVAAMDDPAEVEAAIEDMTDPETAPTNAAAILPKLRARLKVLNRAGRRAARLAARGVPTPAPAAGRTNPTGSLVQAERVRVSEIATLTANHGNPKVKAKDGSRGDLALVATNEGWSVDQVKTVLLDQRRATQTKGPAVIVKSHDKDCSLQALEGAMILRCGGTLDHRSYVSPRSLGVMANGRPKIPSWLRAGINDPVRNRIMENAHRYAEMSAIDLCAEALRLDGKGQVSHGRAATIQAAVSGLALTNVFTTSINAILLATYTEAEDTTAGWVREQDVADYRLQERPRMNKGGRLRKRPKGATADSGTRNDSGETYKIAHYAEQIEIDEQDFINDNLGALSELPVEMGYAAARLRPDLVYAIFLDNPVLDSTARDLFNATAGTVNAYTGAALASATLRAAVKNMLLVQENGVNLGFKPTHLIVPPSLMHTGRELINSSTVYKSTGTNATVEFGSENPILVDNLTLVSDARLENGVTDPDTETVLSGSASDWFLACATGRTIEVGYLRGTGRSPRTRSWRHTGEGKYGMGWDVDMSIGAAPMDWKGLQKNSS
jgi:hypothetical protein